MWYKSVMTTTEQKICGICGNRFDPGQPESAYAEAGEWLAEEIWRDAGELCSQCRENRARLVMMYGHDCNT